MRILVTGATGLVGGHVVDQLLAADAEVRALTRRPDRADLPEPVEVVAGDLAAPEPAAFDGVEAMFLLATGDTRPVADLAKRAGVRRIVLLSSATAGWGDDFGGAYHRAAEQAVAATGLRWTHLRPGMFAANLLDWADAIRAGRAVREPYAAARQAPVHERDIAEVAAAALLSDGHDGQRYPLSGPETLSKPEQAAAIGAALGREVRFTELTPEQWRESAGPGLPPEVADLLLGLWALAADSPDPVLRTVEDVLSRPPRTLTEWAADHAEDFR